MNHSLLSQFDQALAQLAKLLPVERRIGRQDFGAHTLHRSVGTFFEQTAWQHEAVQTLKAHSEAAPTAAPTAVLTDIVGNSQQHSIGTFFSAVAWQNTGMNTSAVLPVSPLNTASPDSLGQSLGQSIGVFFQQTAWTQAPVEQETPQHEVETFFADIAW